MSDFKKELDRIIGEMSGYIFPRAILAGGAITSAFTKQKISDFDLYFRSKEDFLETLRDAYDENLWCVANSRRAITLAQGDAVFQLMHFKWFGRAEDIFASFDFTCCMAALDIETKEFTFGPRFIADMSKRDLIFNHGTDFPLASGLRVLKYQERGYSISRREMAKLLSACAMRGISNWSDLADQIGGHYGESVNLDASKPFTPEGVSLALDAVNLESGGSTEGLPASAEEAEAIIWPRNEATA